jgi:hypothetical protein
VRETEAQVSDDVRTIERENTAGAWLEGFECRLKGEGRFKEKAAERLVHEPDKAPEAIVREIPDAIRYTVCMESANYAAGYRDIKERFESRGYEMDHRKNFWRNAEYKGVNTRWVTPEGQRFEVQFHTPESFHAKHHVTHEAYERLRNPQTVKRETLELKAFQREVSSCVRVPDGATDIPDYRKKDS